MKILIAGGSGTLGKEIINLAFEKNYEVNVLTRKTHLKSNQSRLKYFHWNPKKDQIDLECFVGVDCVINLAGFSLLNPWSKVNKSKILKSRVGSTNFILNIIFKQKIKIKSFINASAISVYKDSFNYKSTENDAINNRRSFLNQVAVKWEKEVFKFQKKLPKISFSIMRIGLVLSKSGGLYKICKILSKLFILSPVGKGNQWQSWIHEKDVARIVLLVCKDKLNGTFNLVAPNPVTQERLINKIATFNNSRVIFPNIPSWLVKILFGEMSEIFLSSQKVKSIKLNDSDFLFNNIDDAIKDLSKDI